MGALAVKVVGYIYIQNPQSAIVNYLQKITALPRGLTGKVEVHILLRGNGFAVYGGGREAPVAHRS